MPAVAAALQLTTQTLDYNFAAVHSVEILCDGRLSIGRGEVMRWSCVAVVLLVVGCQGPKGDPGPPGPPGENGKSGTNGTNGMNGTTPDGGTPPQPVSCTPSKGFCVNNTVATCLLSGADAILGVDCSLPTLGGSASNPFSCVEESACPIWNGACCKRMKPPCTWSFTEPALTGSGSLYYAGPGMNCGLPSTCLANAFQVGINGAEGDATACPPTTTYTNLGLTIPRSTVVVGQTITLPFKDASVSYSRGGQSCYSWTGTVRFDSDVPTWKVTLNLTCSEAGEQTTKLVGTLSGEI